MKTFFTKLFQQKVLIPLIDSIVVALSKFRASLDDFPEEVQVRRAQKPTVRGKVTHPPGGNNRG